MWTYLRTEKTIIGMDEENGKMATYDVYRCSNCYYEATEPLITIKEFYYCPKCGKYMSTTLMKDFSE